MPARDDTSFTTPMGDGPAGPGPRDQQPEPQIEWGRMCLQQQHQGVQTQRQVTRPPADTMPEQPDPATREETVSQPDEPADGPSGTVDEADHDVALHNDITEGPLAGDQPQAIDNPVGDPRPVYDQYEVNSPQNMHQDRIDRERRQQAEAHNAGQDNFGGRPQTAQDEEE